MGRNSPIQTDMRGTRLQFLWTPCNTRPLEPGADNWDGGQIVAVKVLAPPAGCSRDVVLNRFQQEFRVASALDHPHLVRAIDFGVEGEVPFLVMEFVDGPTLTDLIDRHGPLLEAEAIRVA